MKTNTLDALDIICTFTPSELFTLKVIKEGINKVHEVNIKKSDYSPADKQKLVKGVKGLLDRKLMYRLKREQYLVNPYFLVPVLEQQMSLIQRWSELSNGD